MTDEAALRRIVAEEVDRNVQTLRDSIKELLDATVAGPELLDLAGLARLLDLDERTVRRMIKLGHVPAGIRIGPRTVRWSREKIRAWLNSGAPPLPSSRPAGSCVSVKRNRRS